MMKKRMIRSKIAMKRILTHMMRIRNTMKVSTMLKRTIL
jgi:hypothetical protein